MGFGTSLNPTGEPDLPSLSLLPSQIQMTFPGTFPRPGATNVLEDEDRFDQQPFFEVRQNRI